MLAINRRITGVYTAARTAAHWCGRSLVAFAIAISSIQTTYAQSPETMIVRDTEIETLLRDYARPIFKVAGIDGDSIQIIIVNDNTFNAFVADGRRMFFNLGTLMEAETPNELIGVIAHESGHIEGGHLSRLRQQMANVQTMAIVAMLLGAGALAAGAARGGQNGNNLGEAGAGIAMGGQEAALRTLMAYQRSEESAADHAAVRYLEATGQSAKGMLSVFSRLAATTAISSRNGDPYRQSHPLAKDRVNALRHLAEKSAHYNAQDPADWVRRHKLMRAKVRGYFSPRQSVDNLYGKSGAFGRVTPDARYARAHAALKAGRQEEVLRETDALLKQEPNNAFFHELRGQALLERGQPDAALPFLARAVRGNPKSGLIRGMYGQALLASRNTANLKKAIFELERATQIDPKYAPNFRFLGQAYGKQGDIARATLAIANEAMLTGDIAQARQQADRARALSPKNSLTWLKANDILYITQQR